MYLKNLELMFFYCLLSCKYTSLALVYIINFITMLLNALYKEQKFLEFFSISFFGKKFNYVKKKEERITHLIQCYIFFNSFSLR